MRRDAVLRAALREYRLTPAALKRLGNRPVRVEVSMAGCPYWTPTLQMSRRLIRVPRPRRSVLVDLWHRRQYARLVPRGIPGEIERIGPARRPHGFEILTVARHLPAICRIHPARIRIVTFEGRRRRPQPTERWKWFGVRMRFVIQIEGQRRGRQSFEDRIVMVRARDWEDARRRTQTYAERDYYRYLGGKDDLVRWVLEEIVDGYEMFEAPGSGIEPVEIFSKLRERVLTPARQWHPRRDPGSLGQKSLVGERRPRRTRLD